MTGDTLVGFMLGIVAAGVLGFLWEKMDSAKSSIGSINRPQYVVTPTRETPKDVLKRSISSTIDFIIWLVTIMAFILIFLWLLMVI